MTQKKVEDPRKWSDEKLAQATGCYGYGFADGDDACGVCLVRDRCVVSIARKIPAVEAQAGRPLDNHDLAVALGADSAGTIRLCRETVIPSLIRAPDGSLLDRWKADNPLPAVIGEQAPPPRELLEALGELPPEEKRTKKAQTSSRKKPPRKKTPAPKGGGEKKAAKTPKKKEKPDEKGSGAGEQKKAPAAKKKSRKVKAAEAPVQKKETRPPAAKKPKKKKVVKKPRDRHVVTPADEARFLSERRRSPKVGSLEPGTEITRRYKGEDWTVVVHRDHYRLSGPDTVSRPFPTLYSTIQFIAGEKEYADAEGNTRKMPAFSSPRFWKL